ncbi:MAG: serine hydrolase, partial [Planctomycetales bacterium]|nr:serine hydrolase [Planctomycetales bacterium]
MTQKPKRLSLERLEARQCLAASPLVTLVRGSLIVRGTDAAESVWIAHDEAANRVEVRVRQAGEASEVGDRFQGYFETAGLRRIQVQLGGGDDALSIVSQDITKPLVINVNGGSGDDTVYLRAVGNVPAAASLSFDLLGGEGNDSITADVQGHLMGVTDFQIAGGNGDDSLGLSLVALSNRCAPIAKVSGCGGDDFLRVDFGASDGPIGLASHRGIIADGGSDQDTLTAPMDVVSRRVETHQSASSWRAFVNASVQPIIEEMANIGLFVGIVGSNGTRESYSFGAMNEADEPVTSHTAFEIGSITKTFTASLLADMVAR